jgi:hypothetical protein
MARARLYVMVPPKAVEPLPTMLEPLPAVMEEFCSMALVIEPEGRETDEVAVREPTTRFPAVVEARYERLA